MVEIGYEPRGDLECDSSWVVSTERVEYAMHLVETMSARVMPNPNVVTLKHWFVVGVREVTWRWRQRSLTWLRR